MERQPRAVVPSVSRFLRRWIVFAAVGLLALAAAASATEIFPVKELAAIAHVGEPTG